MASTLKVIAESIKILPSISTNLYIAKLAQHAAAATSPVAPLSQKKNQWSVSPLQQTAQVPTKSILPE